MVSYVVGPFRLLGFFGKLATKRTTRWKTVPWLPGCEDAHDLYWRSWRWLPLLTRLISRSFLAWQPASGLGWLTMPPWGEKRKTGLEIGALRL